MNDQYIMPLFVAGSLLLTLFGFFLIAYLLVQKRKQNKYQLEKQKMVFDHQNNLLRTKIEEQENTMDQISKEIHDNIKSKLGYARMSIEHVGDNVTDDTHAAMTRNAVTLINGVIEELHNISHSLSSNFVINIGLAATITKELENARLSKNITYNLEVIGEPFKLYPLEHNLHIYRIAQEAIQNSLKHASATNLDVLLKFEKNLLEMKISDNGIGFDKNKIYQMKGMGFLNMFQRARYVHGTLDVQTAPSKGSTIILTLNLENRGARN